MPIYARKKFMNTITSRLTDYQLVSEREITDLEELDNILKTATGKGHSLFLFKDCLIKASANEYCYKNGFKFLVSEIVYEKNKNIHTLEQRTLTTDYHETPIVNISIESERKAMHQLLIASSSRDNIFPEAMRDIEIEKTDIHVDNQCGSEFKTYEGYDSLMIEKYRQYYPFSNFDYSPNSRHLLNLCGCGARDLEIIYHQNEPIYAQLSDLYNVEIAGFDPHSKKDAKRIVDIINGEVDTIIAKINSSIDKYEKQHSLVKK